MTEPLPTHPDPALVEPRWGLGDAAGGWVAAIVLSATVGAVIVGATGYAHVKSDDWPLWLVSVINIPLWAGLGGAAVYAARYKGNGLVADFGLRVRATDVPLGVAVGLACQFLLVPALSYPWVKLLGRDPNDLGNVARSLTEKAHNSLLGVLLLVVFVAICAPIVEELFYRGLLLRALDRRVPTVWAVIGCGLIFGASHFELLQLPALAAFGMVLAVLTLRTGRLGPAMCTHMAFNGVTVILLVR